MPQEPQAVLSLPPASAALLRFEDVAALTNLGPHTIRGLVLSGSIPAVRVGRFTRIRREDLDAWMERAAKPARPAKTATAKESGKGRQQ